MSQKCEQFSYEGFVCDFCEKNWKNDTKTITSCSIRRVVRRWSENSIYEKAVADLTISISKADTIYFGGGYVLRDLMLWFKSMGFNILTELALYGKSWVTCGNSKKWKTKKRNVGLLDNVICVNVWIPFRAQNEQWKIYELKIGFFKSRWFVLNQC